MQIKERNASTTSFQNIALTNTGKVLFTKIKFKVIPYNTPESYYENPKSCIREDEKSIAKCIASK